MRVFDYMFYRIAKRYFPTDGSFAIRGLMIVSLTQLFLITHVLGICLYPFYTMEEFQELPVFKLLSPPQLAVAVLSAIVVYNYFRYKRGYSEFTNRWMGETKKQKKYRGWLVFFGAVLPFALMFILPRILKVLFGY